MSTITAALTNVVAQASTTDSAEQFLSTPAGTALRGILAAIGVIIVVGAIVKAVSAFAGGKIGGAVKTIVFATILAVFMFNPLLVVQLVDVFSGAVEAILNSGEGIIEQNPTPPPPTP